jgi:MoaA/NifB/PqqE/SkfB family radical SAM enzyme
VIEKFPKEELSAYLNFLQAKYDAYSGAVQVSSSPYYAMIDPCDICQLRCPTCPTGIENEGRKSKILSDTHYRSDRSRLSPELFDALIEELGENLFLIDFHSWGEPLLNEHTPSFIKKAKTYDIETSMHTNLSLKLSDQRIEEILTSGLDNLITSVDGFSQEAYEKFRVGGDIELVKDNLVRAAKIRDKLGLSTAIVYKYLVFSWNEDEVSAAQQFCEEHGLIFLRNDACVPDADWLPSYRKEEKPFLSLVDVGELDQQWERVGQPGYWREHEKHPFYLPVHLGQDWIATEGPKTNTFCGWHYSVAVIQPGGQMAPCCMVEKESDRFGTVIPGEVPVVEVWNNDNYRKSRAVFAGETVEGLEDTDTICTRCYFPDALKHNYSNSDHKVIAQFLHVYGNSEPVLDQAFKLLLEGESEPDREKFVAFFEEGVADLLGDGSKGQLHVAKKQASDTLLASSEFEDLAFDEAAKITQDYMSELSRIGMDGQVVHDISLLPYPKPQITAGLLMLMDATSDQEAKSNLKSGVMVLAFFQPDVGPASVGLDHMGPQQKTWQEVVDREMRNLGVALTERGYGFESESASQ